MITISTVKISAKVNMCHKKYYIFVLFILFLDCFALNCRSDGGPKEEELKSIYMNCVKRQEGKNSSEHRGYSGEQDWRESRGQNQRSHWDRKDDSKSRDERTESRDDRMASRDDRMGRRNDRTRNRDDRRGIDDRMSNRNDGISARDDRSGNHDNRYGKENHYNGRDNFGLMEDEYGGDIHRYNNYGENNQPFRRFKRERRLEMNSGHRSQYNPNSSPKSSSYDDAYGNDNKNTSESSSNKYIDNKSCALHCFLEELEMTGDDGMPDRYLVTHTITKGVKNEDLRDFLQESIEECFQILYNENADDKCGFSKNLMLCLSEKGRANCDDWKDDIQF